MNEGAVIAEREAFCKRLKFAREASGQTLEAISEASKIQVSLLARLERGDMSRWPNGIFRRAFIREYASAIGLPVEQVVNEFTRLFPDDGTAPVVQGSLLLPDSFEDLRLTLAPDNPWSLGVTRTRALAVLADVFVVLVVGFLVSQFATIGYWTATGIFALIYYPVAALFAGTTVALWLSAQAFADWRRLVYGAVSNKPSLIERPRLVFRRSDLQGAIESVDSAIDTLRAAK